MLYEDVDVVAMLQQQKNLTKTNKFYIYININIVHKEREEIHRPNN